MGLEPGTIRFDGYNVSGRVPAAVLDEAARSMERLKAFMERVSDPISYGVPLSTPSVYEHFHPSTTSPRKLHLR